jgi:hypothetical protein
MLTGRRYHCLLRRQGKVEGKRNGLYIWFGFGWASGGGGETVHQIANSVPNLGRR